MITDQDILKQKHEELIQAYREKSRRALQAQEMLDRSKRKEMLGQVQSAASDAVEQTIEASAMVNRFDDRSSHTSQRPIQPSRVPESQPNGIQHPAFLASCLINQMDPPLSSNGKVQTNWAGGSSQRGHSSQRIYNYDTQMAAFRVND